MRSAWLKWARAVEHQRVLARQTREFVTVDSYEYLRFDNAADATDRLLRMHWVLRLKQAYPERWSVLIGDVLTNLRAALDHTMWAAVLDHSGLPIRPERVQFPIHVDESKFRRQTTELKPLVSTKVWELLESVQPFHSSPAHSEPLEVLRWLSNVDKHRLVHVVGRTVFDLGPVLVNAPVPLEVVEEWRCDGPVSDGSVVARLKVKRPIDGIPVDLSPTFAHLPTLQIAEDPPEHRGLASVMNGVRDAVLWVLTATTSYLGLDMPDPDRLELGQEHEAVAAEYGGHLALVRGADGSIRPIPWGESID